MQLYVYIYICTYIWTMVTYRYYTLQSSGMIIQVQSELALHINRNTKGDHIVENAHDFRKDDLIGKCWIWNRWSECKSRMHMASGDVVQEHACCIRSRSAVWCPATGLKFRTRDNSSQTQEDLTASSYLVTCRVASNVSRASYHGQKSGAGSILVREMLETKGQFVCNCHLLQ